MQETYKETLDTNFFHLNKSSNQTFECCEHIDFQKLKNYIKCINNLSVFLCIYTRRYKPFHIHSIFLPFNFLHTLISLFSHFYAKQLKKSFHFYYLILFSFSDEQHTP